MKQLDITSEWGYNYSAMLQMYSVKEAAAKIGITERHVRLLLNKGVIVGKKLGGTWVVLDLNYTRKRKVKGGKR